MLQPRLSALHEVVARHFVGGGSSSSSSRDRVAECSRLRLEQVTLPDDEAHGHAERVPGRASDAALCDEWASDAALCDEWRRAGERVACGARVSAAWLHPSGIVNSSRSASLPAAAACAGHSDGIEGRLGHKSHALLRTDLLRIHCDPEAALRYDLVHAARVTQRRSGR